MGLDNIGTVYLSRGQTTPGVPAAAPTIGSETLRLGVSTRILGAADTFDSYQQAPNSSVAAVQGASDPNSWRTFMATGSPQPTNTPGNTDFGAGINIETTLNRALGLHRINSNAPGQYLGHFSIDSLGSVTFVPEPASAALTGLGTLLLAFRRRRNA